MKFLNFNKVLCISPHPDDVEYSMLGTIMKHQDTEFDLFQLAQGGDCDPSTNKERLTEVENVWRESECKNVNIIFTDNVYIKELTEDKWINKIEKHLDNQVFDAICIPNNCDSHFEHRFVSGFGKALIRDKAINLVQYYTPSTQETWIPNAFVNVSNQYDRKMNCLKQFRSQSHRYYFRDDVLRAFHSDYQCAKKKLHYVEKYKILDLFI